MYMSVKITTVAKQLPHYSRTTEEIIPFLDAWLDGQDERFVRKVKKIFEGAENSTQPSEKPVSSTIGEEYNDEF